MTLGECKSLEVTVVVTKIERGQRIQAPYYGHGNHKRQ